MFTEDMSAFFNPTDFAESVQVTPTSGGAAQSVVVIFDQDYMVDMGNLAASSGPAVTFPTASFPGASYGDVWVIRGVTYSAVEAKPGGHGITCVRLRK
jgi:hypothetical protein